jgi:hypothetical protein
MHGSSFASALVGAMILHSLSTGNAEASGIRGEVTYVAGFASMGLNMATVQVGFANAQFSRASGSQLAWDTVKRFRSGNAPATDVPAAGSPPASDTAPAGSTPASDTPAASSTPSETTGQPTTILPQQGEAAAPAQSGTAAPKAAEGTAPASGQASDTAAGPYKPPSEETTPAGVTIYRGP